MECEKCQDWGFTEQEHGLIRVFCDCLKGREVRAEITGVADDSTNRTGQPDSDIGSTNPGQSKRTRQPKAKRKARAKTG